MRVFFGLVLLAITASAFRTDYHLSEEEFEAIYGGHTDDEDLEHRKAEALAANEAQINAQNLAYEAGESEFFDELNENSDKPFDIFSKQKFGAIPNVEVRAHNSLGLGAFDRALDDPLRVDARSEAFLRDLVSDRQSSTPASYDARSLGLISPVKTQGDCGSCAAFSTVAAIETCMYKANGGAKGHVDLAEETVIDCGYNKGSMNACDGAYPDAYLGLAPTLNAGTLPHEYNDIYMNTAPYLKCRNVAPIQWGAKVTDKVYTYACNDTYMQALISKYGAVITSLDATLLQNYGSGILSTQCTSPQINHAVTAVGYGKDTDGKPYYIVKNSWGPGWGESGFFRIKSGICLFGGFCGVPVCQSTSSYGTAPAMPAKASCDVTAYYGTSLTGSYTLTVNFYVSSVKCSKGICTPTTPQTNACYYICGMNQCN